MNNTYNFANYAEHNMAIYIYLSLCVSISVDCISLSVCAYVSVHFIY